MKVRLKTSILLLYITLISTPVRLNALDSLNVKWLGSCLGSASRKVAYSEIGNNPYLFVLLHGSILVLDLANPNSPQRVIEIGYPGEPSYGWVGGLTVVDTMLYLACNPYGLWIFNVTNPCAPVRIGACITANEASGVAVQGDYAYVASDTGLTIVDISQPTNPTVVCHLLLAISPQDVHRGCDVVVSDTIAYVAAHRMVAIVNIADPHSPAIISTWHPHLGIGWEDHFFQIDIQGNFLYLADMLWGFYIVDVSNPQSPVATDSVMTGWALDIVAAGNFAFGAAEEDGLFIMDISNPYDVRVMSILDTPESAQGVDCFGNYVYVADLHTTLVVDVSNPLAPNIIGFYDNLNYFAIDLAISGNYAYVAYGIEGLRVVDISNPLSPQEVGSLMIPQARGVAVAGNYAYVASSAVGLRIVDISNPLSPYEVGFCDTIGTISQVTIAGDYAYVSSAVNFTRIIDISNPSAPVVVSSIPGCYSSGKIVVENGYAYFPNALELIIANVANPYTPYIIGVFSENYGLGIAVQNNYLYTMVIDSSYFTTDPFGVVDISDPSSPVILDTMYFPPNLKAGSGMAIAGDYVYGSEACRCPVCVMDISNPVDPMVSGYYAGRFMHDDVWPSYQLKVINNNIYVVCGHNGLMIFHYTGSPGITETMDDTIEASKIEIEALPNPFRDKLSLKFHCPNGKSLNSLKIYDISGRLVKKWDGETLRQQNQIHWDGTDDCGRRLPGGVYFCHFNIDSLRVIEKIVLLR
ncbi:MAG: T9SS type A sorting domain-containing protein [candidate division WOR-3 bacterium]